MVLTLFSTISVWKHPNTDRLIIYTHAEFIFIVICSRDVRPALCRHHEYCARLLIVTTQSKCPKLLKSIKGRSHGNNVCDVFGGPAVPLDQMTPRTRGPRTECPPGHVVLGPNVLRQDRMSPSYLTHTPIVKRQLVEVLVERWD